MPQINMDPRLSREVSARSKKKCFICVHLDKSRANVLPFMVTPAIWRNGECPLNERAIRFVRTARLFV